jgi:hypothetical protein
MIRAPQFRNLISIYNFSALHFVAASSITLLAWVSNGAASTGHPAILSITQLALLQRNPKREMA